MFLWNFSLHIGPIEIYFIYHLRVYKPSSPSHNIRGEAGDNSSVYFNSQCIVLTHFWTVSSRCLYLLCKMDLIDYFCTCSDLSLVPEQTYLSASEPKTIKSTFLMLNNVSILLFNNVLTTVFPHVAVMVKGFEIFHFKISIVIVPYTIFLILYCYLNSVDVLNL